MYIPQNLVHLIGTLEIELGFHLIKMKIDSLESDVDAKISCLCDQWALMLLGSLPWKEWDRSRNKPESVPKPHLHRQYNVALGHFIDDAKDGVENLAQRRDHGRKQTTDANVAILPDQTAKDRKRLENIPCRHTQKKT